MPFGPGRRFFRQGWAALRHRSPDMNSPVMIGTSAAFFYNLLVTLAPGSFPGGTAPVYYGAPGVGRVTGLFGVPFDRRRRQSVRLLE